MHWLPEPAPGTPVCLGFDGSSVSDWTCIRAETIDGFSFTPRWDGGGSLWNPAEFGGRVPRSEVTACVGYLFSQFKVERMYCDPPYWQSEIEEWALEHGDSHVIEWETYRPKQMSDAIERFRDDLLERRVTHDGCPDTTRHILNARVAPRRSGNYILKKPDEGRKIDAAVTTVLAHQAAADARATGWGTEPVVDRRVVVHGGIVDRNRREGKVGARGRDSGFPQW